MEWGPGRQSGRGKRGGGLKGKGRTNQYKPPSLCKSPHSFSVPTPALYTHPHPHPDPDGAWLRPLPNAALAMVGDAPTLKLLPAPTQPRRLATSRLYIHRPTSAAQVSTNHCRINKVPAADSADDFNVFCTDLSLNGTFINDEEIGKERRMVLATNDRIKFSNADVSAGVGVGAGAAGAAHACMLCSACDLPWYCPANSPANACVRCVPSTRRVCCASVRVRVLRGVESARVSVHVRQARSEVCRAQDLQHPRVVGQWRMRRRLPRGAQAERYPGGHQDHREEAVYERTIRVKLERAEGGTVHNVLLLLSG